MQIDPMLIRAGYLIGIVGALALAILEKRRAARVGAAISAGVIGFALTQYSDDTRMVQVVTSASVAVGGLIAPIATIAKWRRK